MLDDEVILLNHQLPPHNLLRGAEVDVDEVLMMVCSQREVDIS